MYSVRFNTWKNCFISLPRHFTHAFTKKNVSLSNIMVFKMSWRDEQTNSMKNVLVGWAGSTCSSDSVEMSAAFAQCVQLEEFTLVKVEPLPESTYKLSATQDDNVEERVFVEPNTVNDSEILEHNQTKIEEHLMSQIRVVYPGLVFPVWIHSDVRIDIRVVKCRDTESTKTNTSDLVLLRDGTELIVATKQRKLDESELNKKEKLKIWKRVKMSANVDDPDSRTIFVSQRIADEIGLEEGDTVQLLHVIRIRITPSAEEQQQQQPNPLMQQKEFEEKKAKRSVFGIVRITTDNTKQVITVGLHLIQQLGAVVHATVFLRYCDSQASQSYISSMYVKLIDDEHSTLTDPDIEAIDFQNCMKQWLKRQRANTNFQSIPLGQQNIIQLDNNRKCLLGLNEPIRVDEPTNTFTNFCSLGSNENLYFLDESSHLIKEDPRRLSIFTRGPPIHVKIREDPFYDYPDTLKQIEEAPSEALRRSLERLSIQFSPHRSLREHYAYNYSALPHFLITGPVGTGKSYFAEAIAKYSNVYCVKISCSTIAGDRTDTTTLKLRSYFAEAMNHSPSIIIIDDLDVMCPFEPEEAMPDPNIKVLSTLFIDQVSRLTLYSSTTESEDPFEKIVTVIATSKSTDTLNKIIQSSNIFESSVNMSVPDRKQRTKIFNSILNRPSISPYVVPEIDLEKIILRTENYSAGDIESMIMKMINVNMRKRLNDPDVGKEDQNVVYLTMADFETASQDFVTRSVEGIKLVKSTTKFSNIGGLEEVKQMLRETFEFPTKYSKYFEHSPIKLRSGLLLYGPPGCGKTFLASAVAGECGLNFISVKGPELLNKYIGASEQSVRDVFRQAEAAKPCIIFFDEFDSIAAKRGHDNTGVTDRVVNQFLTQLDGVESRQGVYVLAATSRPDLIDAALLRPGRLDKAILCPLPNAKEREHILHAHSQDYHLAPDLSLAEIAHLTEHYSGADLQGLLYTASLIAAREHQEQLQKEDETLLNHMSFTSNQFTVLQSKKASKGKMQEHSDISEELTTQVENVITNLQSDVQSQEHSEEESLVLLRRDHIIKALEESMPSLNANERAKYDYIYDNFVNPSAQDRQYEQRVTLA